MKLYFKVHDYKYAAEQMLLTMFPQERPEYPQGQPEGDRMELSLGSGEKYTTAVCSLYREGRLFRGRAAAVILPELEELEADRIRQRLIKNAMYRAALKSGVKKPAWGALTGVRPGKLLEGKLSSGMDEAKALAQFIKEYDVSPERAALCLDTGRETLKAAASLGPRDVCLYVGIPFCPTRCAYCSFVSQSVEKSMKLIAPFQKALHQELKAVAQQVKALGLKVVSIYMGGGTPTTLSAGQLHELCSWLEEEFDLSHVREYTVEAGRPDTITLDKLRVLRSHGVDRLSVNPQTMEDSVLELIGRRHTAEDIIKALELVRKVGSFAVNMDLIAGLPGDSVAGFQSSLKRCSL
ncbi:MAG: radical SAM protein [Oscillospiraceae bacterium]